MDNPKRQEMEISSLDADFPRGSVYAKEADVDSEVADLKNKPKIKKNTRGQAIADGLEDVVKSILIPALKKTASTMLKKMVDVIIYQNMPTGKKTGSIFDDDDMYVAYDRSSIDGYGRRGQPETLILDNFYSRDEAMRVLRWMKRFIEDRGELTVGRLYDYLGESKTTGWIDYSRGWRDLEDASVFRSGSKWCLELPEPR